MKLYVGNLPWSVDDGALKEMFSSYGVEEAVLIKDKYSGRSKGFGFVTINDDDSAKKAIADLHEKDVQGRPLTVSEARPMVPRDDNRGGRDNHDDSPAGEAPSADSDAVNDSTEDSIESEAVEDDTKAEESAEEEPKSE